MNPSYKVAFVVVLTVDARGSFKIIRGVSRCYELVIGYHAGKDYFTIKSDRKFNHDKPKHFLEKKIPVYYSPVNGAGAVLGGAYGTARHGLFIFLFGSLVLFVFWFF